MNGRKIKTSRTFYGKSDKSDLLRALRPRRFPYAVPKPHPEPDRKKSGVRAQK
jgi:hypothetical protein